MTSFRQFQANRRNALKSTGPNTAEGKQQSRRNAVRHGLTAETVIGALEDAEDYKAFEASIIADYDVQSAVERELVLRLASLLWRLRRATTIETGLFDMQAEHLRTSGRLAKYTQRPKQRRAHSPEELTGSTAKRIRHQTALQTRRKPRPILLSTRPPIWRSASCVSQIYPTMRLTD